MPQKTVRPAFNFQHAAQSPLGQITLTGYAIQQRSALLEPRVFGQYAIAYLLDGGGTYTDENGWTQELEPGDLIFVFPTLRHFYNPHPGTEWTTTYLCFQGPIFELWQSEGVLDPRRPVRRLRPVELWSRRLSAVLGSRERTGFVPALVEICRVQEFLAQVLSGENGAATHQEDLTWAKRACRLVASMDRATTWEDVARRLGGSVESFRKRFARVTGMPPGRYRRGCLIDRACELMKDGHLTDAQIADALGYCDEFYFSRCFKQVTGKAPSIFRRDLALGL